jgi:hypothetical protein
MILAEERQNPFERLILRFAVCFRGSAKRKEDSTRVLKFGHCRVESWTYRVTGVGERVMLENVSVLVLLQPCHNSVSHEC